MKTFATVLFVHQEPVGYRVLQQDDQVELVPAPHTARAEDAPHITAIRKETGWQIQGTAEQALVAQVHAELQLLDVRMAEEGLSAAP